MFPSGALSDPFHSCGFRSYPRLFMTCNIEALLSVQSSSPASPAGPSLFPRTASANKPSFTSIIKEVFAPTADPPPILQSWQPEFYDPAAAFIQHCYAGHMDSQLNDQYQTHHGAQRFLHNIIRFPGCGLFAPEHSWLLRNPRTFAIEALLLSSRVRSDVAHITQLCVDPTLRGQGLGQQLLAHHAAHIARAGVKTLSLTVTEANTPAVALYLRNTFTTLHRFEAMIWQK
jgi:GNAT superfamily N-acetyltransferase